MTTTFFETRGVLAGAYRGGASLCLTHLVEVAEPMGAEVLRVSCRVNPDNIVDAHDNTADERAARPSCPTCARAYDRRERAKKHGGTPASPRAHAMLANMMARHGGAK